ncbi:hypothetical protein DFH06DRAFT_710358 [Mycena polygramma]|nr:hypothetical protein DFH06DRAFT_710358 [Mycena polygramma]
MLVELEADRARVAELQTRILAVERTLSELRLEQSKAQARLDSYKYPLMTLPNEIVYEIFVRVLPPYPDFPWFVGPSSPTVLAQVCRCWRHIALGISTLWSGMKFSNLFDPQAQACMFETWLERSCCCPLSLDFGNCIDFDGKLIGAALPHRARLEYLKIDLYPDEPSRRILDGAMPLLRHLELMVDGGIPLSDCIALCEVPLLRTVVLNGVAASRLILPWSQLTSLTLHGVAPSDCVPILLQTPDLVRCELHISSNGISPPRDIQLPCLEGLALMWHAGRPEPDFLPRFIVPALRSLKISEAFLAPNPIDSLTKFFSKSSCTLEELYLTGVTSVPEQSYRNAFPSLLSFNQKTWEN